MEGVVDPLLWRTFSSEKAERTLSGYGVVPHLFQPARGEVAVRLPLLVIREKSRSQLLPTKSKLLVVQVIGYVVVHCGGGGT